MSLLTVDSLKKRFRIEDTDSDDLLGELLTSCIAAVETHIGRVILDDPTNPRVFGIVRAEYPRVRGLRVSDLAVNTRLQTSWNYDDDYDRTTNLPDRTSLIGQPPLSTLPDYPRWEAICNQAIADFVADLYYRPNSMELGSREGSVSTNYGRTTHAGIPDRVARMLKPVTDLSQV